MTLRRVMDRELARLERDLMAKTNDLDRLVGAMYSPKEVVRILGRAAKRAVYHCRIENTNPIQARLYVESTLRTMCEERGYVRFGVHKTIGKLVGKVMSGYESGYHLVQPKIEKAKERYERHERAPGKYRYWDHEQKEDFLRQYWGPEPR